MSADSTLVIIPTYNERENLPSLLRRLDESVPAVHVLIVDDNSPDATAELACELFAGQDGRFVHVRTGRRGLGRSYVDGYRWALDAGYERVVQMDADLSHDPGYVPALIQSSETADVSLGSRYCEGGGVANWPVQRLLLSRFANRYVAAVTAMAVRDSTSGFRCYTRHALERIGIDSIQSNGYAFQVEMTYRAARAGLRIVETPITFVDRQEGRSKISRAVLLESMIIPWKLRAAGGFRGPLQVSRPPAIK